MNNRESFTKHFERYFRLKRYQGEDMFKSNKGMVREEALKYYKDIKDVIPESEYANFFEWLERSQISYVDISQFSVKVYNWTQENKTKSNTSTKTIPPEFKNFLDNYGCISEYVISQRLKDSNSIQAEAYSLSQEYRDLKRISMITTNFACPGRNQTQFMGTPANLCYNNFYGYLFDVGIKNSTVDLMEAECQKFKDQVVRLKQNMADGKKKVYDIIREMRKEMTVEYGGNL